MTRPGTIQNIEERDLAFVHDGSGFSPEELSSVLTPTAPVGSADDGRGVVGSPYGAFADMLCLAQRDLCILQGDGVSKGELEAALDTVTSWARDNESSFREAKMTWAEVEDARYESNEEMTTDIGRAAATVFRAADLNLEKSFEAAAYDVSAAYGAHMDQLAMRVSRLVIDRLVEPPRETLGRRF